LAGPWAAYAPLRSTISAENCPPVETRRNINESHEKTETK
jgi:hypothetical protein